jgi:hypothetical protein
MTRNEDKHCPACNGHRSKYTILEVDEICRTKNIECLESTYQHGNVPMDFRCLQCSRKWKTTFRSVVQNIGCLKCTWDEKMKLSLEDVYETLEGRGITCLATEYTDSQSPMMWKCDCDHEWLTTFNHIRCQDVQSVPKDLNVHWRK